MDQLHFAAYSRVSSDEQTKASSSADQVRNTVDRLAHPFYDAWIVCAKSAPMSVGA
jgi:hypothetical protein